MQDSCSSSVKFLALLSFLPTLDKSRVPVHYYFVTKSWFHINVVKNDIIYIYIVIPNILNILNTCSPQ